jgi:hypothetical protein
MPDPTLGSDLYSGAAVYGRIVTTIGAVIGLIIALILIVVGIEKLRDPRTARTTGSVTKVASCHKQAPPQKGEPAMYACIVDVAYLVGGTKYSLTNIATRTDKPLAVGSSISLQYNPKDPSDATSEAPPHLLGFGLILGGVAIGGVTTLIAWLARRYKGFAAFEGTASALGSIARVA